MTVNELVQLKQEVNNTPPPLSPQISQLHISPTLKTLEIAHNLRELGHEVISWGLGENPLPRPACLTKRMIDFIEDKRYTSTSGFAGLAEKIAQKESIGPYKISKENVVIATGVKQVLFNLQMCFGGEILHVVPYWVSYSEQTTALGKKVKEIHTKQENRFKLTPEDLLEACRDTTPRLLIFNAPTNPTGLMYNREELKALASTIEALNLIVASDEIYLDCCYDTSPASIAEYLPNQTIRLRGLSKEYSCGGDRIGYATFPSTLSWFSNAMHTLGSSQYSCAPVVQQHALERVTEEGPELEKYKQQARLIFKLLGKRCAEKFREIGLHCETPEAAWYVWIDFTPYQKKLPVKTNTDLCTYILEKTGLLFVSGSSFGMPEDKLYLRGSFVDFNGQDAMSTVHDEYSSFSPWADRILNSIDTLGRFLRSL
jgi:aspartate aminotransferase